MIGYVTLGTNDLRRAQAFYDTLLAEMGVKRLMEFGDRGSGWFVGTRRFGNACARQRRRSGRFRYRSAGRRNLDRRRNGLFEELTGHVGKKRPYGFMIGPTFNR